MASPLAKIIQALEEEACALRRSPPIPSQSPANITRYLELINSEAPIHGHVIKKRAQEILRIVKQHSRDLFVLCALTTKQQTLGTVKWTRTEALELCGWWDQFDRPTDILEKFWYDATQNTPLLESMDTPLSESMEVTGAWLMDTLKGRENTIFLFNRGGTQPATIELNDETSQALAILAKMRGIVRN